MRFRGVAIAAAAAAAFAATLALGLWQWHRGAAREAIQSSIDARAALAQVATPDLLHGDAPALVHRRAELHGRWDAAHTVFLDNRQMAGRQGFYVVTPLVLTPSAAILVQRGWVPRDFEDRTRLPRVYTPAGDVTVQGLIAPPPAKLYELGVSAVGPIRQNLDIAAFRAETRLPLLEVSLQQSGAASEGLLREWPPAASGAERNFGYAFQWWAMSGLVAILYVWFQLVVPARRRRAHR